MPDADHYEQQYLDLMRRIWAEGHERVDRTGVGTRALFGATMRFSLADDAVPLLTTKRVYWKAAAREIQMSVLSVTEAPAKLQTPAEQLNSLEGAHAAGEQ